MKIFTNDKGETPMVMLSESELVIVRDLLTQEVRKYINKSIEPVGHRDIKELYEQVVDAFSYF